MAAGSPKAGRCRCKPGSFLLKDRYLEVPKIRMGAHKPTGSQQESTEHLFSIFDKPAAIFYNRRSNKLHKSCFVVTSRAVKKRRTLSRPPQNERMLSAHALLPPYISVPSNQAETSFNCEEANNISRHATSYYKGETHFGRYWTLGKQLPHFSNLLQH